MVLRIINEVDLPSSHAPLSKGKCIPSCVVIENQSVRPDELTRKRLKRQRRGLNDMDLGFDSEAGAQTRNILLGC